jgi:hypothetical protein
MTKQFHSFVVFAEMRTGSNFLEANLNAFAGIKCHGEAFNPHFIGYPNTTQILGVDQAARDMEPGALLCVFRRIRPPIPTTSGHLFQGIRPPVTSCREAACFGYQS